MIELLLEFSDLLFEGLLLGVVFFSEVLELFLYHLHELLDVLFALVVFLLVGLLLAWVLFLCYGCGDF